MDIPAIKHEIQFFNDYLIVITYSNPWILVMKFKSTSYTLHKWKSSCIISVSVSLL